MPRIVEQLALLLRLAHDHGLARRAQAAEEGLPHERVDGEHAEHERRERRAVDEQQRERENRQQPIEHGTDELRGQRVLNHLHRAQARDDVPDVAALEPIGRQL